MAACLPGLLGSGGLVTARPAFMASAATQPQHPLSSSAAVFYAHRGLTMRPQVRSFCRWSGNLVSLTLFDLGSLCKFHSL
jgi:hypothetical protein